MNILPTASALFSHLPGPLRRHRLITAWMKLTGEDPVQPVRIRADARGFADMRDGFLRLIVIEKSFEPDFFRVADALLSPGSIFVDVGANHGLMTFGLAAKARSDVEFHLFEPNPVLLEAIARSLELHPTLRACVNPVAVSDHEGIVEMLFRESQTGTSHVVDAGGVSVPSTTLDSYFQANNLTRIRLLKIDVEGHEFSVLRGADASLRAGIIDAIYFEYFEKLLEQQHPPAELLDYLDSLGYVACFNHLDEIAASPTPQRKLELDGMPAPITLVPIDRFHPPPFTDLMAVRRADLRD